MGFGCDMRGSAWYGVIRTCCSLAALAALAALAGWVVGWVVGWLALE